MRSMMSCGSFLILLGLIGFVLLVPAVAEQVEALNAVRLELYAYIGAPDLTFAVVGVVGAIILFLGMIGQEIQAGDRGYQRGSSYSSGYQSSGASRGGTLGTIAGLLLILCLVGTLTPVGLYVYRDQLPFELPYDLSVVFGDQGLPATGGETPTPDLSVPGIEPAAATEIPMVEPTPTAPLVLERGWTLYEKPECNASIALPPAWAVVNLEAATLDEALAPVRAIDPTASHPWLEEQGLETVRQEGFCLIGLDMGYSNEQGVYTVSFNILRYEVPNGTSLDSVEVEILNALQTEGQIVPEQRRLTLPAGEGLELRYRTTVEGIDYQTFKYILVKDELAIAGTYRIEAVDFEMRQYLGEQLMQTFRWLN